MVLEIHEQDRRHFTHTHTYTHSYIYSAFTAISAAHSTVLYNATHLAYSPYQRSNIPNHSPIHIHTYVIPFSPTAPLPQSFILYPSCSIRHLARPPPRFVEIRKRSFARHPSELRFAYPCQTVSLACPCTRCSGSFAKRYRIGFGGAYGGEAGCVWHGNYCGGVRWEGRGGEGVKTEWSV
jgi:hypothetical protein